jgi:hypothetical protein
MIAAGMPGGCLRSGYRDRAEQAAEVERARLGLTPSAAPVGSSYHGEGVAADVDPPAQAWVIELGAAFGWIAGTIRAEPWHVVYDPARDHHATTTPQLTEDDDMARLIRHPNGTIALAGPGPRMTVLRTMTEVQAMQATGQATGPIIQLPDGLIWRTCKAVAERAGDYK